MIYCDRQIETAIRQRRLIVEPVPHPSQYDSSSLNLRVGDDFRIWKNVLGAKGTRIAVNVDDIDLADIIDLTEPMLPTTSGLIEIPPKQFVLVRTHEYVYLPLKSKLAARVEGRSKQARLGMTAHITAPTIHAGFGGKITLEILNHGPFVLQVRPRESQLCQLIIEEVSATPKGARSSFTDQATPLGTPRRQSR